MVAHKGQSYSYAIWFQAMSLSTNEYKQAFFDKIEDAVLRRQTSNCLALYKPL